MIFTEFAVYSSKENLFFVNKRSYIQVYDLNNGCLGNFEVWHDSENENREYFNLNETKIYIETIPER